MSLLRLAYKKTVASNLTLYTFSWMVCSGGNQLHCEAALWRGRHGGELRPAYSHVCELGSRPPLHRKQPNQLSLRMSLQPWLTAWLQPPERPQTRGTHLSCSWMPNPQRLWDNTGLLFSATQVWGNLLTNTNAVLVNSLLLWPLILFNPPNSLWNKSI